AQISMIGGITGATVAPLGACAGFGTALKMADDAIQAGQIKMAVVGTTAPSPHALSVGAFYAARVISHDGQVSKPLTEMRGTHVSGGACIWIVGDYEHCRSLGMKPLGLEVLSVALSSDAEHIITPSAEGPQRAIRAALDQAGVAPDDISTWDMHATATPGDWNELQNALRVFGDRPLMTARKGSFGHGMSVCGGWELTAQHMGFTKGVLHPVNLQGNELHAQIAPYHDCLVCQEGTGVDGNIAGKINMGIGGINACVICRRWEPEERE
ncbi:beta-ketoacyl synthase, partial [Myxococcota bacterium]|nr:beta-ketoacyl synthase [Myxococcota bacterium]